MAIPAKNLIDNILGRVRDPQGMATTRVQVLGLLGRLQQTINASLADVVSSALFNVPPFTQIFPISGILPAAVKILAVRGATGHDLDPVGERADMSAYGLNTYWLTEAGDSLETWGTIGRDLLVLRPGLTMQQTVTIFYTDLLPSDIANEADLTSTTTEGDQSILDLGELLVRMKSRDFEGLNLSMQQFMERMKLLRATKR